MMIKSQSMVSKVGMDLGIVIALKEEFREFLALLPVKHHMERDPETGQYGYVFELPVTRHRCVITLIGGMNPGPAALQTDRLMAYWSPRTVVMLGIAAGVHSDVRVGDVIIANQVDDYLASAKAQPGNVPESFEITLSGTVYKADFSLLTQVSNFEFSNPQAFSGWRSACVQDLAELVPEDGMREALVRKGLLRKVPDLLEAHLASGQVVGAAQQFSQWLQGRRDRNLKALDMESAGFMAAAMSRVEPARTLVIRGISDYGDERKSHFDAVGEGALRRYAMRNAIRLLWALLENGTLSGNACQVTQHQSTEGMVSREAPFIGISIESLREGFKGRERALEEIRALLCGASEGGFACGNVGRVFVHGGGGIGKSRLVTEYAHRYRSEYPGGVFFARMEKRPPLELWAEFARALFMERAARDEESAVLEFIRWLADASLGPRLLVFDDVQADSLEELAERFNKPMKLRGQTVWPIVYSHVHLLMTTRQRDIPGANGLAVYGLESQAATELLISRAKRVAISGHERKAAMEVASRVLGGHPLALALAGAYVRHARLSFVEYLEIISNKGLTDKLEEAAGCVGYVIQDRERSIVKSYEISRRQLKIADKVDALALRMLTIAAFLAPSVPIDRDLVQRLVLGKAANPDLEEIGFALTRLTDDLSLLDPGHRDGGAPADVMIHPLVADYTRWGLMPVDREQIQIAILASLIGLFPNTSGEYWLITQPNAQVGWEWLSPQREAHVVAVWEGTRALKVGQRARLSWALGDLYLHRGELRGAQNAFQAMLDVAERLMIDEPSREEWQRYVSVGYSKLGDVLMAQAKPGEARIAYEKSLEMLERLSRADPSNQQRQRDVSLSYCRVGDVLVLQGRLEDARTVYDNALRIAEQLAGSNLINKRWQWDLALCSMKVGYVLDSQGLLEQARAVYGRGLEIFELLARAEPGNQQWQHGVSMSHMYVGDVLLAQGKIGDAHAAYERGLRIAEKLANSDPSNQQWQQEVLKGHVGLGDALKSEGKLGQAHAVYEKVLEISEQLVLSDPSNQQWQRGLWVNFMKVGDMLLAQGRVENAREAYEKALGIAERIAGGDLSNQRWQRDVSVSYTRVGDALVAQGRQGEARAAYEKSLGISEFLAQGDPSNQQWGTDLASSCCKLAKILGQGSGDERVRARELFARAHRMLKALAAESRLTHEEQHSWLPFVEQALSQLEADDSNFGI